MLNRLRQERQEEADIHQSEMDDMRSLMDQMRRDHDTRILQITATHDMQMADMRRVCNNNYLSAICSHQ